MQAINRTQRLFILQLHRAGLIDDKTFWTAMSMGQAYEDYTNRDYVPPMWPGPKRMPEWMKVAGRRMKEMGMSDASIVTTLKAMRRARKNGRG